MRYTSLLTFTAMASTAILPSYAQEVTASGNLQTEASWSALQSLVNNALNKAKSAQITADSAVTKADNAQKTADAAQKDATDALTRIKKAEACGKQGMLYAPGAKSAHATTGCLPITITAKDCTFDETDTCGKEGCQLRYYNRKTEKWVTSEVPTTWKDGDVYVFHQSYSDNNYKGGQCRSGKITFWYTGD